MNILYIEDEPLDAELVERYLQTTVHSFIHVSTLDKAHAALESQPDLILVDVMLHDAKSGFGFVQGLRAGGYRQPIVAVTGLALPQDIKQCYEVGFTDVLTKPYAIKELATLIRKYADGMPIT